jgi:DNA adenine methylase
MILSMGSIRGAGSNGCARPFLKWAGGKGQLLPELIPRVPSTFKRYFEPFVGGAAVFLALHSRGLVDDAVLGDVNPRLIDTYRAIRDDVEGVIAHLAGLRNEAALYYAVRAQRHESLSPAEAAARIIFLNKTCYNGLFRENRQGQFNVPFGRYARPKICDPENLRAASRALRGVMLTAGGFERILASAKAGDFVYLDPPYHPLSRTASFTGYHEAGFGETEQRRLAVEFRRAAARGVHLMLSNSDTHLVRELYDGFLIEEVLAARAINSKSSGRGKISELVVRNYDGAAAVRSGSGAAGRRSQ